MRQTFLLTVKTLRPLQAPGSELLWIFLFSFRKISNHLFSSYSFLLSACRSFLPTGNPGVDSSRELGSAAACLLPNTDVCQDQQEELRLPFHTYTLLFLTTFFVQGQSPSQTLPPCFPLGWANRAHQTRLPFHSQKECLLSLRAAILPSPLILSPPPPT